MWHLANTLGVKISRDLKNSREISKKKLKKKVKFSWDFTKSLEISPDLVPSKTTKSNIWSLPVVVLHGSCKM